MASIGKHPVPIVLVEVDLDSSWHRVRSKTSLGPIGEQLANAPIGHKLWSRALRTYDHLADAIKGFNDTTTLDNRHRASQDAARTLANSLTQT